MGRHSQFTQEKADRLCELLIEGKSLRKAAEEIGHMQSCVLKWLKDFPAFQDQYTKARQVGYLLLAEELLEISDDKSGDVIETENGPRMDGEFVARSRLRVDSRKWLLSKMLPKVFGDKVQQEVTGADGGPVESNLKIKFVKPNA